MPLRIEKKREQLDFPFATINIVLLLLFFFIVTGSIVGRNETGLTPPLTLDNAAQKLPRPLLLIDKNGRLFLNDRPVSIEAALASADRGTTLNVVADRDYDAGQFLGVLDRLRGAGLAVRIVTLKSLDAG